MATADLQRRLGHDFGDPDLLRQALTHRSFGQPNNERLEFLGDSVLNCVVATLLYQRFGSIDEGDLSRRRAALVRQDTLHAIATGLELGDSLRLGEGEARSGGARRPSILADALEAIVGAVFLDAGFERARSVIARLYEPILAAGEPAGAIKDPKTQLQELLQARRLPLPRYSVVATGGVAHEQVFEVDCAIPKLGLRTLGRGPSRRAAEQAAAAVALEQAAAAVALEQARIIGRARVSADGAAA
jgi:ribonuclease-3